MPEGSAGSTPFAMRFLLFVLLVLAGPARAANVVLILADDLGWKDVGFNGSEIKTPNLDRMAKEGVQLNRYYAQPTCSPTRASLMTGKAAFRLGVSLPIDKNSLTGLPLGERTLPQVLVEAGYQTGLAGKWHLGHAYTDQLPMARGFDSAYGHLLGGVGQWDHVHGGGLDWHRNGKALRENGYSTHLLVSELERLVRGRDPQQPFFYMLSLATPHLPNEAPEVTVERYQHIDNANRRVHAAMVDEIDQGIGRILRLLVEEGIQEDTLVWFMSDNGGLIPGTGVQALDSTIETLVSWFGVPLPGQTLEFVRSNIQDGGADNGPYRRGKGSIHEGSVRVPSVVYWPGKLAPRVVETRISVQDVFPSLLEATDISPVGRPVFDGVSQWPSITGERSVQPSDYATSGVDGEAFYRERWKLVVSGGDALLFNLEEDPHEQSDLAAQHSKLVLELRQALENYPRGESIHQTSWWKIASDPDRFGGPEDRPPWVEQVRVRP